MGYTIELGPNGNENLVIADSDIYEVDIQRPATAMADYEAVVPFDKALRDRALDKARVYADGQLVFRGYLKELDWDQRGGTTRLYGPGIGADLQDSGIVVSATREATHKVIRRVWKNHTNFNYRVYEPDVDEVKTDETVASASTTTGFQDLFTWSATDPIIAENGVLKLADTSFYFEGEAPDSGDTNPYDHVGASGGQANQIWASSFSDSSYNFTTNYDVPANQCGWALRQIPLWMHWDDPNGLHWYNPEHDMYIDGEYFGGVSGNSYQDYDPTTGLYRKLDAAKLYETEDGTYYDETSAANDSTSDDMSLVPTGTPDVGDAYYFGVEGPFDAIDLIVSRTGDGNYSIAWEYYAEEYDSDGNQIDSGWRSIPNVSDGTNLFQQSGVVSWNLEDIASDTPNGGSYTEMASTSVDGDSYHYVRARLTNYQDTFDIPGGEQARLRGADGNWLTQTYGLNSDLAAGDHTLKLDVPNDEGRDMLVDGLAFYDGRFSYTWDNRVDSEGGALDGPEPKPTSYQPRIVQQKTDFNVIGINLHTTWNDVSGPQQMRVSADGRQSWYAESNTSELTKDYPDNAGATVDASVTLGRLDDSTRSTTPLKGTASQELQEFSVAYDGSTLSIVENNTFRGPPLKILKELHRMADYRFAIDHAATDQDGNLVKVVESFERGTQKKTADWDVINRNPKDSWTDYANEVTIWGALQDDGTRPKVTLRNDAEVSEYGKEPFSDTRPNLETLDAVKSETRAELKKRVGNRDRTGTLDVHPVNILPGYVYDVDWFGDGQTTATSLNRVSWSEAGRTDGENDAQGTLDFDRQSDVTGTLVDQGFQVRSLSETV